MFFAHREHQKQKSKKFVDFHQNHEMSVSVIVPCFNEDPQRLNNCLESFYREMLWTLKHVHKHHFYMLYELIMQFFLPLMFVFAFIMVIVQSIFISTDNIWKYLAILIGIALLSSVYGIYRTKDFGFLRFVAYGFIHVFVLIPTRLYSIATISDGKWGTR